QPSMAPQKPRQEVANFWYAQVFSCYGNRECSERGVRLDDPHANGLLRYDFRPLPGDVRDVAALLDGAVARAPDRAALIGRHARYTYAQLDGAVNAAAAALRAMGLAAGDRLAASMPNTPEMIVAFLAS